MLRTAILVLAMYLIWDLADVMALAPYKDYILATLLTVMLKPWVMDQFD